MKVTSSTSFALIQRINLRLVLTVSIFLVLVGYPVFVYVDAAVTGGVKQIAANVWRVDLKALGNYAFDDTRGTMQNIPEKWRLLDGKTVILQGFPYPTNYAQAQVPEFQFVYNISRCCLGGPPQVQERVFAHARDGATIPLYNAVYCTLEGTLHVRLIKDDTGKTISVYDLDVDRIEPVD